MKENEDLITVLNSLVMAGLTATNPYKVPSGMRENWGYAKLYLAFHGREMNEMRHAEWRIDCINCCKGTDHSVNPIKIGKATPEMDTIDHKAEPNAFNSYKSTIELVNKLYKKGTLDLLAKIPETEEGFEN